MSCHFIGSQSWSIVSVNVNHIIFVTKHIYHVSSAFFFLLKLGLDETVWALWCYIALSHLHIGETTTTSEQVAILLKLKLKNFYCPLLEYAGGVWGKCTLADSKWLEELQLKDSRIVTGLTSFASLLSIYIRKRDGETFS